MNNFDDESSQIIGSQIISESLDNALSDRYLTYALSTIMNRALPDARDGLKPVHRRILFAMRGLKLDASGTFRKCAKIVGEVMGNYHPHGDKAIYDALARLAQDFNVRYPLIDGQGNFGNIDGDNPAAQRYTEARLTKVSELLLDGLAEEAVDFRENYDGSEQEPTVLPAGFPHLLGNGSSGIAVGMATNIPPHNIVELANALVELIRKPSISIEKLVELMPGPDFPTGGVIVDSLKTRIENYSLGRGSFRLRSRYELEKTSRGMWHIAVTQIPFQVQKSKLIEKIADLITEKKISALADVRDESDDQIRIILEPRSKAIDPKVLMEALFRNSDLEIKFSLNMNVLLDGITPKVCSLKETMVAFLNHRRDVLLRRSKFRIKKIDARLNLVEGYLVAFANLDRVIEIIRTEDDPKLILINEFDLNDLQAEAILNLRLRALRKLEELELQTENLKLTEERSNLDDLIENQKLQWKEIKAQIEKIRDFFNKNHVDGERRTSFEEIPTIDSGAMESFEEKEPITIVYSSMGWIRAMRGHIDLNSELKYRDGDKANIVFHAFNNDKILAMASNGRCYSLMAASLPGGRGMGEPIRLMIEIQNSIEIVSLILLNPGSKVIVASNVGRGFVVSHEDLYAQTRNGKQILNLGSNEKLIACTLVSGDFVASIGNNGKMLIFPILELPEMARGKGVRIQKFKDGGLSDVKSFYLAEGLSWKTIGKKIRTEADVSSWIGKRASSGRIVPHGFPKNRKFSN